MSPYPTKSNQEIAASGTGIERWQLAARQDLDPAVLETLSRDPDEQVRISLLTMQRDLPQNIVSPMIDVARSSDGPDKATLLRLLARQVHAPLEMQLDLRLRDIQKPALKIALNTLNLPIAKARQIEAARQSESTRTLRSFLSDQN